jgi:hypothetical protein
MHASPQDDPRWHAADSDKHESEGEGERYEFGQECLDRISLALGGNTIVPLASTMLPALMQDADWKKRHAALICLSQIAEGCVKVLTKNISGLADLCLMVRTQVPPEAFPSSAAATPFTLVGREIRSWRHCGSRRTT